MSVHQDVIVAGFGGQGVLLAGNLLAAAAMEQGLASTFFPVYGPEMRGGTCNCTVVLSDEEIGSPVVKRPNTLIALNRPSLEKFQGDVREGGLIVFNSNLADPSLARTQGVRAVGIAVNDIAESLGDTRLANMVALGAYAQVSGALSVEALQKALDHVISAHHRHLIPKNVEALVLGAQKAKEAA